MLKQRIVTALILFLALLAALFLLPNRLWALLLAGVLTLAAHEWGGLAGYGRLGRWGFAALTAGICLVLLAVGAQGRWLYGLGLAFWLLVAPFWLAGKWQMKNPFLLGAVGWLVLLPTWQALVNLQRVPSLLLMLLSVIWVADTAAYFFGKRFGRRKLAPRISPGKTWEGAIGALLSVAAYAVFLALTAPSRIGGHGLAWMGLALALMVLSVEGDLFESWMKRVAGLKDSGQLLPGHGGVLDRIDGLTSTMPLAALALGGLTGAMP